jgi:hypothetical protein
MKLTETKDGVVIEVFVKPNTKKFEVVVEGEEIVIHSTEEPAKGKVNRELTKELTRLFHARVELASGATSREKRLLIRGAKKTEVESILQSKPT